MTFEKQDVERLSARLQEPSWLLERRLESWDYFEKMELPNEREDESWRYTELRRLKFKIENFAPAVPDPAVRMTEEQVRFMKEEGERGGYIVQRDADTVLTQLDSTLADQGVIFCDLATAARNNEELLQQYLFSEVRPDEGYFTSLHGALFSGGTFLYVPRGVSVELPLEAQRWIDQGGSAIFPHTLVVLEEGAEVTYLERYESGVLEKPAMSNGAVEVVAAARSRLSLVVLQEFGSNVWHFQTHRTIAERDAQLKSLVVAFGGRFSRQQVETVLRGEHATSEMLGLYFADKGQHFDFRTRQDHIAKSCFSDLLYKGALKDVSRTVYAGVIRVAPGAAQTDAYQTNRNLVLSDDAKADSKPELEIENNDVKCSHAASVGQINEEEIFYLLSRGIPRPEAERLIVNGFFEEVAARIGNEEIKKVVGEAVERKLAGV